MPVRFISGTYYDSNIVVVTGERPFIVDAGTGMHSKTVIELIKKALEGARPEKLVLTHRHIDHVGGAADLSEHFDLEVLMHEIDAPSVEEGDLRSTAADAYGCKLKKLKVTHLKDGDKISNGDSDYSVIHTPGHTSGSISLFNDESGVLISGDTVFVGGVGRWDLPTGNREELGRSVKTLLSMKPKDLYPGHGQVGIGYATEALKEALEMLGEI
ncbi:MAG: MBL fold metallo-hydrolase [Euryarchaeota archaeon]|nr:MBL fold metallo-hydrolase [Euryarchaeota archaeon]